MQLIKKTKNKEKAEKGVHAKSQSQQKQIQIWIIYTMQRVLEQKTTWIAETEIILFKTWPNMTVKMWKRTAYNWF